MTRFLIDEQTSDNPYLYRLNCNDRLQHWNIDAYPINTERTIFERSKKLWLSWTARCGQYLRTEVWTEAELQPDANWFGRRLGLVLRRREKPHLSLITHTLGISLVLGCWWFLNARRSCIGTSARRDMLFVRLPSPIIKKPKTFIHINQLR